MNNAIRKLISGKSEGFGEFMSDHLKYAGDKLSPVIAKLINAMLSHGYNPSLLLHRSIVSVPKDNRDSLVSSDNERGISLVNSMCKLIDIIIIEKCQVYLHTSDLQFSFKSEHSTNMCTAVFTETVSYFVDRGSNVYACLLDASKAFDRVHYGKLFSLLLNRKMPAFFIRLIIDNYLRQTTCTQWKGVKQGGVLSPLLFTVYFDELITRLKSSGLGCNIGDNYFGALGYADDLTLLLPSVNALTKMITIIM